MKGEKAGRGGGKEGGRRGFVRKMMGAGVKEWGALRVANKETERGECCR